MSHNREGLVESQGDSYNEDTTKCKGRENDAIEKKLWQSFWMFYVL